LEDCITDLFCLNISKNKVSSIDDANAYVRTNLNKYVQDVDPLVITGASSRIAVKLLLFSIGKPAPTDGGLGKLLRGVKLHEKYKVPLVNLYHLEGIPVVVLRIPEIGKDDSLSRKSLEAIFTLIHYTMGVKPENMSYHMDATLGQSLILDAVHLKLIDELTSSASSPLGIFPGEVIKFGDYQGNLPTLLSTMHLLSIKQNFLRSRTPKKKEEVIVVRSHELKNIFNMRTGLNDKTNSYNIQLLRGVLSVICSHKNKCFPGGWIASNRSLNKVKSDSGLLYKLGYVEVTPYNHKLVKVIFNDTITKPDGKLSVRSKENVKEYKTLSFIEFRTGVCLTCPKIDITSTESFDSQVKRDALSVKSSKVLGNFHNTKYYKINDSLNKAHALLQTIGQGDKKNQGNPL
jgi:hypothetical protein